MLRFSSGAASHVGLVRDHNEDAGFAGPYVQLVADGVGGAAAGEVASATTAYVVSAMAAARPAADPVRLLTDAVAESHRQLRRGVADDPARAGMATTLTALLARHERVTVVHVGDSRAYLLRDHRLSRLTSDDTFVQALIDQGRLTPDDAKTHPYRSVVLKSVNADQAPEPAVWSLDVAPGDRLLVCSDGLSDLVDDSRIEALLRASDPDEAAAALVEAALAAGGRDNVTCLVTDLVDGPAVCPDGRHLGTMRDPYLVVDPAAVRADLTA
ncbi:MAG: PP2C family protein-serine/threonine phosphatase [Nocardioides sp.]